MRSLATIQKIRELRPIPNADKIEVARVLGWEVVVGKDEFKEGDWCVYVEIDSILPDLPPFEFLKDSKNRMKRIKTVKFKGQVSQGIVFPLDVLMYMCKRKFGEGNTLLPLKEGFDVTEIMEVTKYEPPEDDNNQPKPTANLRRQGHRPTFCPKTDQTRVEVLEPLIEKYRGYKFWISEKLDGSSWSAYYCDGKFGVCSRNLDVTKPRASLKDRIRRWISIRLFRKAEMKHKDRVDAWNRVAIKYDIEKKMRDVGKNLVLQGEMVGPKIQGNKYKLDEPDVYLFDIYDIDRGVYLDYNMLIMGAETFGMKTVPIIETGFVLDHNIDQLSQMSDGYSRLRKETLREGVVFKPMHEIIDPSFDKLHRSRVSFKVVSKKFLLKYGE